MAVTKATWTQKSTGNTIHPETEVDQIKASGSTALNSVVSSFLKAGSASAARTAISAAASSHTHLVTDLSDVGSHNGIYRGKDLTTYFNNGGMSAAIANGTFDDIYPGDYITKSITVDGTTYSNVKWIIGDLDYHLHRGDTETTAHHVLVFPEGVLGQHRMNETNTTEGGYVGSEMWTTTIPKYVTGIQNAFGSTHVLSHKELLTTSVDMTTPSKGWPKRIGMADNWAWTTVLVNLFNEAMVYGTTPFSSSGFDVGECNTQVSAMRLNKSMSFSRSGWSWLRAVVSGAGFAGAAGNGNAGGGNASHATGRVRPYFLLT